MKVSIVAAYNNKLDMTIDFLDNMQNMSQDSDIEIEMILVNGGNPVTIKHPFITKIIIMENNLGFTKVLNQGLKAVSSDSDYVFMVGNDSFPTKKGWLKSLIQQFNDSRAVIMNPNNDRPGQEAYRHLYTREDSKYFYCNFYPSIAWLFKRSLLDEIGLLDEDYPGKGFYADNDYCERVCRKYDIEKIIVSKDILLLHLLSAEGQTIPDNNAMEVGGAVFRSKWR